MVSIDRHLETIGKYEQKCTKVLKSQRKFKLVKRRELIPPVAMKFFHSLKWVSINVSASNWIFPSINNEKQFICLLL